MRYRLVLPVFLACLVAACSSDPTPPPGAATSPGAVPVASASPSINPAAIKSALEAQKSGGPSLKGDLTAAYAGSCVFYKDSGGTIWLKPSFAVSWLGGDFPTAGYSLTAAGAKAVTGTLSAPGLVNVGISGAFLGQTVTVSFVVDPEQKVAEGNEGNNTVSMKATVPSAAPTDTAEHNVSCV